MRTFTRLLLVITLLVAPLWVVTTARAQAQDGGVLTISTPETDSFPAIHFNLDAYNAKGEFLSGLQAADVDIIEDGQPVKAQSLESIQNGLQIIFAINASPALANQNKGASIYQAIQKSLVDWAQLQAQQTTTLDDFSFSTPSGLVLTREQDPKKLQSALSGYQPDLAKSQPTLGSLAEALDLATDPTGRPMMKRAILYISPSLPANAGTTLADLTGRAKRIGVRVNVWQVASNASPDAPANPLKLLAESTGGVYQNIPTGVPLPEIEPLFAALRHSYQVQYVSGIHKSGAHSLTVQAHPADQRLASNETSFNLAVQPPNPIFLSPPASIQRYWATPAVQGSPTLAPEQVSLQILVEFPDQHKRELKATRLYVNGKMVQENTQAPFDRFTWSIGDLTTPARQTLRVEAIDSLGLSGTSIEIPIDVTIDQPAKTSLTSRISESGLIALAAVVTAGSVLVLVFVLTSSKRRGRKGQKQIDKKRMNDPLTQPVPIRQEAARAKNGSSAEQNSKPRPATAWQAAAWTGAIWPRSNGQNAPARLVCLDENEQPITGGAIPLSRQEITFGTDPHRATQVLESPTVSELHARLYRDPEGNFFLADQGSVAGTWVNYAPITANGARLENGDLIHIGKVLYRFEITDPARAMPIEIKVTDLEL